MNDLSVANGWADVPDFSVPGGFWDGERAASASASPRMGSAPPPWRLCRSHRRAASCLARHVAGRATRGLLPRRPTLGLGVSTLVV